MSKRDTIRSLAKEIERLWPHLRCRVESWTASTDRKVGRLLRPGKGRKGTLLRVFDTRIQPTRNQPLQGLRPIYEHNSAETYRRCSDVRAWMRHYAETVPPQK